MSKKNIVFRTPYGYFDTSKFAIECEGSVTEQAHAANGAMDPNVLFRRPDVLNELTPPDELNYGDFSDVGDYTAAMTQVVKANESFDALPAQLRDYFDNSAHNFVDFMSDPDNLDEAIELGLVSAPPSSEPEAPLKSAVEPNQEAPPTAEGGLPKAETS